MSIYVVDPWDALSVGFSGAPPGWSLFGSSVVNAPDGAFGTHQFGSGFFGSLKSPVFSDPNPSPTAPLIQIMFGSQIQGGFNFSLCVKDINGNPLTVLILSVEGDKSLSLKCAGSTNSFLIYGGSKRANSGGATGSYFFDNVWYYFQLNVGVMAGTGAGAGFLQVTSDLIVDGIEVIPGSTASVIPLSNFPTVGGINVFTFDQCIWNGNTGFLSQVQVSDQSTPPPDTTQPYIRIPQTVLEASVLPVNADIRIPQVVIEASVLPNTAYVRIAQMVIELCTPHSQSAQIGWIVKEC